MTLIQKMKMLVSGKAKLIDIYYYIQGNYRYHIYYGGKLSAKYAIAAFIRKRLIRKYIKEQITYRIRIMNQECYSKGSCVICGCETTALQMANKQCEGLEYPPIMSKYRWKKYKVGKAVYKDRRHNRVYLMSNSGETLILKETIYGLQRIDSLAS